MQCSTQTTWLQGSLLLYGYNFSPDTQCYSLCDKLPSRLKEAYPVLYTAENGRNAHEFILNINAIKTKTGISEKDIAKRLMDYGFHAPTMSWPAVGTLMVRVCAALLHTQSARRRLNQPNQSTRLRWIDTLMRCSASEMRFGRLSLVVCRQTTIL